jgi:pyruvate formate lyase activating enzyme
VADLKRREAMHYGKVGESTVRCLLCPHLCLLEVGERGRCRSRVNLGGTLIADNYGMSIGIALDPIEKKPLYHFRPGSRILSLGPNSCNLSCFFCQNYGSSQEKCRTHPLSVEDLAAMIRENGEPRQVAFTYTEPLTWYEYIYDFAQTAPEIGIVLVTNGFINPQPLEQLLPSITALNIDLKAIDPEFYRVHCGGNLETVKQTIRICHEAGKHLELTNLLIPGLNDSDDEIARLAGYIAEIDDSIPLHISAYHPAYLSAIPATPASAVVNACRIASKVLHFVYAGNIMSSEYRATTCPSCGRQLITPNRRNAGISKDGNCSGCGARIYGVFDV